MSTRLYAPAACAPGIASVAANGTYNYVSELVYRHLASCKTGTILADGVRVGPWTIGQTAIGEAIVSPPLNGAGTLSGTWQSQFRSREYAAADDAFTAPEIYIVSGDGTTVRGTAWAIGAAGPVTELNTVNRNKTWADGDSLTPVAWQDGDHIVYKPGFSNPGTGSTPEASNNYGDDFTNTDLPVDESQTTAGIGWIEFSQNLSFKAPTIRRLTSGSGVGATITPASVTPTADARVVYFVAIDHATIPTKPSTNGLTWQNPISVTYNDNGGSDVSLIAYTGTGATPTAGQPALSLAASVPYDYCIFEIIAGGAVLQSKTTSNNAGTVPPVITFDNAGTANSVVVALFQVHTVGTTIAPSAGIGQVYKLQVNADFLAEFCQVFQATMTETDNDGSPRGRGALGLEIAWGGSAPPAFVPTDQLGFMGFFGV